MNCIGGKNRKELAVAIWGLVGRTPTWARSGSSKARSSELESEGGGTGSVRDMQGWASSGAGVPVPPLEEGGTIARFKRVHNRQRASRARAVELQAAGGWGVCYGAAGRGREDADGTAAGARTGRARAHHGGAVEEGECRTGGDGGASGVASDSPETAPWQRSTPLRGDLPGAARWTPLVGACWVAKEEPRQRSGTRGG